MAKPHHWEHLQAALTAPVIGAYTITMTLTDKPIPQAARWHLLGAGAMGCLWACAIQAAQNNPATCTPVSLLLRNRETLLTYPGHVKSSDMTHAMRMPAHATADNTGRPLAQIDNLLVATKAQDTLHAIESIAASLSPTTRIVLLQNGLKVQREIGRQFGAERVFCLSTSHGAWLRAPFDVVHAGDGDAWLGQLGPVDDDTSTRLQTLLSLLPAQQLNIRIDNNIAARLWHKLAVNCAINALTVIHNCRNGELLRNPVARQVLTTLCGEISALMQALPDAPMIADLYAQVHRVLTVTADNLSSTLQDVRRGRRTEIDHLNGYLCELAVQHHLPCPANVAVLQQMRVIESRAQRAGRNNIGQHPS